MRVHLMLVCCGVLGTAETAAPLFRDDFSDPAVFAQRFASEGGVVEVKDGRLFIRANPGAGEKLPKETGVWIRQEFAGDLAISFSCVALSAARQATDLQVFLHFSTTEGGAISGLLNGTPLGMRQLRQQQGLIAIDFADTEQRDGKVLTGAVVNTPSRFRLLACPGGKELANVYAASFVPGQTYAVRLEYRARHLRFLVDGQIVAEADDQAEGQRRGQIGIRTWLNDLAIDDLVIAPLP